MMVCDFIYYVESQKAWEIIQSSFNKPILILFYF